MEERLVVRLAGVASEQDGITTFVFGSTRQKQVEEDGRTRRRRERRPEARLANTRVNRTAGKTPSTWKKGSLHHVIFGDIGRRYGEEPESRRGQCREVFRRARGEFLTGKGKSWVVLVQVLSGRGQDWTTGRSRRGRSGGRGGGAGGRGRRQRRAGKLGSRSEGKESPANVQVYVEQSEIFEEIGGKEIKAMSKLAII